MIFQYYGLDWLIFALLLLHVWLLGERNRFAFVFGVIASILNVLFGWMIGSLAIVLMSVIFTVLHFVAYIKWSLKQ